MREIPECLNRRYQALDELMKELSSIASNPGSDEDYATDPTNDPGVRLMCDFWNILKEDPDCNLTQAVRQRMGLNQKVSTTFRPQHVTCYMACCQDDDNSKRGSKTSENKVTSSPKQVTSPKHTCEKTAEVPTKTPERTCCSSKNVSPRSSAAKSDTLPLTKVLCNLKEAVSFDKKCNIRIGELLMAEKQLQDQIQHLEHREKEGMQMLKQADCMWSCMEEAYKKKVAESQERQNLLLKQMKEIEASNTKWRKNKKDLEFQCDNINKCYFEIMEKMHEKQNDVKCIKMEVENTKKRIASNKKDTEAVKKSFGNKKTASDAKVASLSAEITRMKKLIEEENYYKNEKEQEGTTYVKEARADLQKICRVLLQKRLENEDLKAEKEALLGEIEILKQTCAQCKDKCQTKQQEVIDEIAKLDAEITGFKVRCIRCHECTDTADVRKFCTDCPRCAAERDCTYEDDHCMVDSTQDCVCMTTKQKFLDNVFDNMYTVLERQVKTCSGKAVAQAILDCLKRSRNGKLNNETRNILQDFVLTTVKKNLNLTIIGGAVKTRCEMDPETYKQLMLCLKQVKTVKAPKVDQGTEAKKDPCRRWGGTSECNCPKGPKACICTKKAPPPPNDPEPCPPEVDKEDAAEVTVCPHKDSVACGADCAMHATPSAVGTEVASWRPAPCDEKHCQFSKNMRAAQCVLGPDSLSSVSKSKGQLSTTPYMPNIMELEDQISCKCGPSETKPCSCRKDEKHLKPEVDQCDQEAHTKLKEQAKIIDRSKTVVKKTESENQSKQNIPEKDNLTKISNTSVNLGKKQDSERKKDKTKSQELTVVESKQRKDSTKLHKKSHKHVDPKKLTLENKNVKFGSNSESQTGQRNCVCEDHFKVSVGSNSSSQFTKLINTPSGSLAMELDEQIIKQIEQEMQGNSSMAVALRRTASGHLKVELSPQISSNDIKTINVNRSTSGALLFEVNKKIVDILKPDLNIDKRKLDLTNKSSITVTVTAKKSDDKQKNTGGLENLDKHLKLSQEAKMTECSDPKLLAEAKDVKIGEQVLKMKEISGTMTIVKAKVTKTVSGHTVFTISDLSVLGLYGEIISKCKDSPVQLSKTPSGAHLLNVESETPNATMRRTLSGHILIQEEVSVQEKTNKNFCVKTEQNLFKVSIKDGKRKIANLPVILKETTSNNYVVIVDKEYETHYKDTVKDNLNDDYQCPVELVRTLSYNYLLNIDESNENINAFIVRSPSGNIKILSNISDKVNRSLDYHVLKADSTKTSSKVFENLLHHIPATDMKIDKLKVNKPRLLETKSSSDSNLYEKVRLRLQNEQNLLSQPSALLKKTSSGKYAVVLNKESKKAFINNLKTYLASNSKGLIPISRTESGEITIVLNSDSEFKGQYGSLKITPSGNIYVLVDEKVVQSIVKTGKMENPIQIKDDSESNHNISKINNTTNKVVTTTCNAFPETCSCDPSKCICAELLKHGVNESYINQSPNYSMNFCKPSHGNMAQCELKCNHKCCDCGQCPEDSDVTCDIKSPHIVIKPCNCRSSFENKWNDNDRPLYYVTEAICPFHKDRYDTVSNELLEISGLCNKFDKSETVEMIELNTKINELGEPKRERKLHFEPSSLDYLDFMPPQLPAFLKDFRCA